VRITEDPFQRLPTDYLRLCQGYVPRPLHGATDYAAAGQALELLMGFEDRLTVDHIRVGGVAKARSSLTTSFPPSSFAHFGV
jgi:hypothetical protein